MRVLHIANSYGGTTVYTNLFKAIDSFDNVEQLVYVPLNSRNHERVGQKMIDFKNQNSEIHYSVVLKNYHRFIYSLKISRIVADICSVYDVMSVNLVHAGTAFFDGAVAYELYKRFGIPYIVTIRDTDVNSYYRKLFHKRSYFHKVLKNSSKIIFISPRYKNEFVENVLPKDLRDTIWEKCLIRTNGVDQLFLDNINYTKKTIGNRVNLLFTGAFISRKGLLETIEAVKLLRDNGLNLNLTAVGKGLPFRANDAEYINKVEVCENQYDWLSLKQYKPLTEIIEEMREADIFVMNSHTETFGLCYVEALTQKLPVIYTKNQGFDGFFDNGYVGYAVDSHNVNDIAKGISYVVSNYEQITNNISTLDLKDMFGWNKIAEQYLQIYKEFSR